jgi:hypothetical protein
MYTLYQEALHIRINIRSSPTEMQVLKFSSVSSFLYFVCPSCVTDIIKSFHIGMKTRMACADLHSSQHKSHLTNMCLFLPGLVSYDLHYSSKCSLLTINHINMFHIHVYVYPSVLKVSNVTFFHVN